MNVNSAFSLVSYEKRTDDANRVYHQVKLWLYPDCTYTYVSLYGYDGADANKTKLFIYKSIARNAPRRVYVDIRSFRSRLVNTQVFYNRGAKLASFQFLYEDPSDNFRVTYPTNDIIEPEFWAKYYAKLSSTEYIERYKYYANKWDYEITLDGEERLVLRPIQ